MVFATRRILITPPIFSSANSPFSSAYLAPASTTLCRSLSTKPCLNNYETRVELLEVVTLRSSRFTWHWACPCLFLGALLVLILPLLGTVQLQHAEADEACDVRCSSKRDQPNVTSTAAVYDLASDRNTGQSPAMNFSIKTSLTGR